MVGSIGLRQQNARLLTAVCQQRFSAIDYGVRHSRWKAGRLRFSGIWRATTDSDEHYVFAIALR